MMDFYREIEAGINNWPLEPVKPDIVLKLKKKVVKKKGHGVCGRRGTQSRADHVVRVRVFFTGPANHRLRFHPFLEKNKCTYRHLDSHIKEK